MGNFKESLIGGSIDLGFGAVGSGLQTLFGIASSKYNADLQYQYNTKLADDAYKRQVDFWNLQNAYNTPAAQVSRLRQAGLNPALLNGGVQGNTAGNLSSVPTASVSAGGAMPSSPAANLGAMADTMSKLASAGMVNEQTKYWMEQAIGAGIENEVKRLLRAKGWTEAAIAEMDRAARWKATHPGEDLPANPLFDSWEQPDDGVNEYVDNSENKKADTGLKKAQTETEEFKQANLEADSALKIEQANSISSKLEHEIQLLKDQSFLAFESAGSAHYEQKLKEYELNIQQAFRHVKEIGELYNLESAYLLDLARISDLDSQDFYRYINATIAVTQQEVDMLIADKKIASEQKIAGLTNYRSLLTDLLKTVSKGK